MPWSWHPFKIISLRHMERKTNLNEIYPLYDKSLLSINTTSRCNHNILTPIRYQSKNRKKIRKTMIY